DDQSVSSKALAEAVSKTARSGSFTHYAESLDAAEKLVHELVQPGDVLFFQGAGDIDDVARRLISSI
ncbi:MAG: UDP-N-acetylmuramate-L-alanine ligase, partial [Parcubacteria group bacterium GW2011_GWA2_53_21]